MIKVIIAGLFVLTAACAGKPPMEKISNSSDPKSCKEIFYLHTKIVSCSKKKGHLSMTFFNYIFIKDVLKTMSPC